MLTCTPAHHPPRVLPIQVPLVRADVAHWLLARVIWLPRRGERGGGGSGKGSQATLCSCMRMPHDIPHTLSRHYLCFYYYYYYYYRIVLPYTEIATAY